ncbi:bifunctional helix-turn-helix transcriptional regulator/GNAT family N-acetyltransferase [Streptomyces inhibens]|uniref:bifunctional helix-turn-helix transcriptional regulator/GNAT family N-acetyltransferase n=1 Tax=Streptomyces inhibens TaxID=2293571 RepID=UPI001EE6BB4D|nr:bifunctional helix-turn-helix transcriptional regulator/GNAT family N-acetyltransferase [Streptomyces inhibens]UKY50363.1 helix-turn-helix domain-containing GNAT family N-acetyltransferase [Streptomyces inhibens]
MTTGTTSDTTSGAQPGPAAGEASDTAADVRELRRFNRFYTNLIGALDYGRHLYTPFTLTEARVLYELAHQQRVDAADLRASLSLDAGYLSRLLGKFEDRELITRGKSERDPRRQRITLTKDGRNAAGLLEERSQDAAGSLLERLPVADRARLVASMRTIRTLLDEDADRASTAPAPEVTLRTTRPGDLGWMVERNAALYAAEYGFDLSYEALVARIVAEYAEAFDPRWDRTWIAELGGERAGAVMCVRDGRPGVARLRLLLVEPGARGHGVGRQLVDVCVEFARDAGYAELVLWTNSILGAARSIYQRAGFELVAESAHHSFGQDLAGQDWRLAL